MVGRSQNRKADDSIDHLARGGLPINPQVLKAVKESLSSGEFRKKPESVWDAVKSDPGLFVHVAKHMKSLAEEIHQGVDPLEQLKTLEEEKLQKLFAPGDRQISVHRLKDATPAQLLRFQHTIISSRTAEALAPSAEISPELAFSTATLRQLGHSLLAWNYPEIYARALLHQRSRGVSLEVELKKLLGLSPAEVGMRFAADWNLRPELRRVLSPKIEGHENAAKPGPKGAGPEERLSLAEVLNVSELFAKANDPQHYPKALEQWAEVEHALEGSLGINISALIRPAIQSSFNTLQQSISHSIDTPFFEKPPEPGTLTEEQGRLAAVNPYLKRCEPSHRLTLDRVYQLISPGNISVDALRVLVDSAIPQLGFVRGCLYLFKRDSGALRPALRVGDRALESYNSYREGENNPVSGTLNTHVMLKQQVLQPDGSEAMCLFGSVLNEAHPGVLYLEVDPALVENPGHDSSLLFNAIRKVMGQCLGPEAIS